MFELFGILDPETHARATVEVWVVHMCSGLGFLKKCALSIFELFGESKGHQPVSRSSDLILPNFPDVTNANGKLNQDAWGKVGQTKQKNGKLHSEAGKLHSETKQGQTLHEP